MFTLLPTDFNKNLVREYRLRLAVVGSILLFFLIALLVCFFLPTFILVQSEQSRLTFEEQAIQASIANKDKDNFSKVLSDLKSDLDLVAVQTQSVTPVVDAINAKVIPGITVLRVEYKANDSHRFNVIVAGIASTRKALSSFANELKTETMFASVDLPVSNLAKDFDLPFTITLEGTPN